MPADARRRRAAVLASTLFAASLFAGGCADEPSDPVEARRERVQDRLEDTFSRQQAECILEQLDDDQLQVIDAAPTTPTDEAPADLEDPTVLEAYSNAAVACVVGFGS